jgi:hypothetical protein
MCLEDYEHNGGGTHWWSEQAFCLWLVDVEQSPLFCRTHRLCLHLTSAGEADGSVPETCPFRWLEHQADVDSHRYPFAMLSAPGTASATAPC